MQDNLKNRVLFGCYCVDPGTPRKRNDGFTEVPDCGDNLYHQPHPDRLCLETTRPLETSYGGTFPNVVPTGQVADNQQISRRLF